MAVFSDIILHKRVLEADQLIPSSHVWNDRPFLHRKNLEGERSFFATKFDSRSFISSKNQNKEDNFKRNEVDNLNLHRKRSFIDQ